MEDFGVHFPWYPCGVKKEYHLAENIVRDIPFQFPFQFVGLLRFVMCLVPLCAPPSELSFPQCFSVFGF